MKRVLGIALCFLLCSAFPVAAADTASTSEAEGWKSELAVDKQAIATQKDEMKQNAQTAHAEEKSLHQQIREAKAAGDTAKVESLKAQLKATHQENISEKKSDRKEIGEARKELNRDKKAARFDRADRNDDGKVDRKEKKMAKAKRSRNP